MAANRIEIKDGKLITPKNEFEELFQIYVNSHHPKPIVLYFHGGAVRKSKVNDQIDGFLSEFAFKEEDCFPIYFLWNSGILEVFQGDILEILGLKSEEAKDLVDQEEDFQSNLERILDALKKKKRFKRIFSIVTKIVGKKIRIDTKGISEFESPLYKKTENIEENVEAFVNSEFEDEELINDLKRLNILAERNSESIKELSDEERDEIEKITAEDEELLSSFEEIEAIDEEKENNVLNIAKTVATIAYRIIKRYINKKNHELLETILEEILRQYLDGLLKRWWNALKNDISDAFDKDKSGGALVLLDLLEKYWQEIQKDGAQTVPIYIVSSSAGSHYVYSLIKAVTDLGLNPNIKFDLIYLIPAVTMSRFYENIQNSSDRINSLRIYALNDKRERTDNLIKIYPSSILYFISALLEEDTPEPILGMERFHKALPFKVSSAMEERLEQIKLFLGKFDNSLVWAPSITPPDLMTNGKHHQKFTKDVDTLRSLNAIIRNERKSGFIVDINVPIHNPELEGRQPKLPNEIVENLGGNLFDWEAATGTNINSWDDAYKLRSDNRDGEIVKFVEPDLEHKNVFQLNNKKADISEFESFSKDNEDQFDPDWNPKKDELKDKSKIWHLEHAQLREAIEHATSKSKEVIRIAHIDTGYDPDHITFPHELIAIELQRNFIEGEDLYDATDRTPLLAKLRQPKHGKGTLGILAGKAINDHDHEGPIGLTKNIEIAPIRIAESVVLFKTKAFVKALRYIIDLYDDEATRIHIVTMSMGGLASKAWATLVNEAYEKGIFIVSAAGNNFGRLTPRVLVYPARFNRVVAACGVTYDYEPYYKRFIDGFLEMQGNFGPKKYMNHAVAAFTPNTPWAKASDNKIVQLSGGGTSSATPQIAIAAALYLMLHFEEIKQLDHGWQKVEAIRNALYKSCLNEEDLKAKGKDYSSDDFKLYFGNGILQARKMLDVPVKANELQEANKDHVSFPLWSIIKSEFESLSTNDMMELEIQQLVQQDVELQKLTDNEEKTYGDLSTEEKKQFLERLVTMEQSSDSLKRLARYALSNNLF